MARGGRREGAGRPLLGEKPKEKINITIDAELLEFIDEQTENRSAWIEELVRQRQQFMVAQSKGKKK